MTTLAEYITDTGLTQSALADRLGISRSYMSEIVARKKTPSFALALRIHDVSEKVVDLSSLISPGAAIEVAE